MLDKPKWLAYVNTKEVPMDRKEFFEPFTLDGPYELKDGRVQEFFWVDGQLIDGEIFSDWSTYWRIQRQRESEDPLLN